MSEFNQIPTSISHKQLHKLFIQAHKELSTQDSKGQVFSEEKEVYNQIIKNWSESSKELLTLIGEKKQYLTEGKNPNSLMALGAFEVHINMAIQALKASEEQ